MNFSYARKFSKPEYKKAGKVVEVLKPFHQLLLLCPGLQKSLEMSIESLPPWYDTEQLLSVIKYSKYEEAKDLLEAYSNVYYIDTQNLEDLLHARYPPAFYPHLLVDSGLPKAVSAFGPSEWPYFSRMYWKLLQHELPTNNSRVSTKVLAAFEGPEYDNVRNTDTFWRSQQSGAGELQNLILGEPDSCIKIVRKLSSYEVQSIGELSLLNNLFLSSIRNLGKTSLFAIGESLKEYQIP